MPIGSTSRAFDVIVIGGGHAGAEAAWAASSLGAEVALISLDLSRIGAMSCNPAIGGLAKGQMVREIDALGGLMGLAIDATGIQFRMLNRSKGPAVWGPRAQADKYRYAAEVQRLLRTRHRITLLEGEVAEILTRPLTTRDSSGGSSEGSCAGARTTVTGIRLASGDTLLAPAVIVTTGTFLKALMHTGEQKAEGGRVGEQSARTLSDSLRALGLDLGRLKTGTPPRLHRDSINFSAFTPQPGDPAPAPFSFLNEYSEDVKCGSGGGPPPQSDVRCAEGVDSNSLHIRHPTSDIRHDAWLPPLPQVACYLTHTSAESHELIRQNLHRAPMYSGQIQSTGPRYCPSIEDKVVRFADKPSHHLFLEPESLDTPEIYVNGLSTSLPADVQECVLRSIPGLEKCHVLKWGYAVEYDMVWPTQTRATLETKLVRGLFVAGQINGTSGYEEAAAQGLMAGLNAAHRARKPDASADDIDDPGFVLRRDEAYIGVLIDDLVTKPPTEPYRMFTSRAEHRLQLRAGNADERLTPVGRSWGLVPDERWHRFETVRTGVDELLDLLRTTRFGGLSLADHILRAQSAAPHASDTETPPDAEAPDPASALWEDLARSAPSDVRDRLARFPAIVRSKAEITLRYEGYIARAGRQNAAFAKLETKRIPDAFDYTRITGLRNEARQKLTTFGPRSLGQAMRISGITPADVTLLAIHLAKRSENKTLAEG